MLLILQSIHFQKNGTILIPEKMLVSLENGKKNINIGHQLVELITLLEIGILFAPVHQLKNTLTSIIKFYYFGCFTNNPIFSLNNRVTCTNIYY